MAGTNCRGVTRTAAFAVLVAGCGANTTTATTKTVTNTVTAGPTVTATVTYTPPPPPGPKTTIDTDGTYAVGTDIVPGTYRTTGLGTDGEPNCYWARLRSLDTWDIISNNNSTGQQVVAIEPSDAAFLTQNCAPWQKSG
jgi:hypothetical protein